MEGWAPDGPCPRPFVVSLEEQLCVPHPGSLVAPALGQVRAKHGWLLYHSSVRTSQVPRAGSTNSEVPGTLLLSALTLVRIAPARLVVVWDSFSLCSFARLHPFPNPATYSL